MEESVMVVKIIDRYNSHSSTNTMVKILGISAMLLLTACQPKSEPVPEEPHKTAKSAAVTHTLKDQLIIAKTIALKTKQTQTCDEEGCTHYDFQTVETNHPWINQYFLDRIQKTEPLAFEQAGKNVSQTVDEKQLNESSIVVRFVGQNQHLATFEMLNYTYSAGAAHGMYHKEFVNFDLNTQKRIALQDLLQPNASSKVIDGLFSTNGTWLSDHSIEPGKLQLSDNFYYGANGIVFVYPLYELASYAEGMSELNLPYFLAKDWMKPEYLPNLPKYVER